MEATPPDPARPPSLAEGRVCVVLAAVLWSLSGAFTRVLTHDTPLRLGPEPASGTSIAFYRVFFAGLVLLPLLRRQDVSFRPMMLTMVACFAIMNVTFISAMAWGQSSNAILLQYTAPMWMYLASVWWLGEPADRRGLVSLIIGLAGIGVILAGGYAENAGGGEGGTSPAVLAVALVSGLAYGGVMVCLRVLRGSSSRWLTVLNHLCGALVLVPFLGLAPLRATTAAQLGVLFLFGTVQMALPYWLVARGLRSVSPQEAGVLTLLEPILNPLWAYLVAPEKETPHLYTLIGGAFILGALAWRYWPRRNDKKV
jgi:DME family drug/metabolite transporter